MLKELNLSNVGPSPSLHLEFGSRLNLLTGDNGLGKSFLLDIAWWVLTRRWPSEINRKITGGLPARPVAGSGFGVINATGTMTGVGLAARPVAGSGFGAINATGTITGGGLPARPVAGRKAEIQFTFTGVTKPVSYVSHYDRKLQSWTGTAGRPANPGLVLYAQVDGSFSVWDPARNYWRKKGNVDVQDRPPAYVFSPREVWDGLHDADGKLQCNGLISDWAGWQKEKGQAFQSLCAVLAALSASELDQMSPGELTRIGLDDPRDIPTLQMPYGQAVPVLEASAGMKRIIALAYLLVWSWEEHKKASEILGQETATQVIFLIDEVEAHLHPRWQRQIIRALMSVMQVLTKVTNVQIIAATHSPLVLASVEPVFDSNQDAWFDLDFVQDDKNPRVELVRREFVRRGDVSNWLTSPAFDLPSARSIEAETVLRAASAAMDNPNFNGQDAKFLDGKLRAVLGELDPFWMRWRFVAEKKGWLQ